MKVKPENVDGKKIQKHTFTHKLDWGYIAISVAVLVVVYVAYSAYNPDDDEEGSGL